MTNSAVQLSLIDTIRVMSHGDPQVRLDAIDLIQAMAVDDNEAVFRICSRYIRHDKLVLLTLTQ